MPAVTIYTKFACGYCISAKRLLASKGVDFEEIKVTLRPKSLREMVDRSGGRFTAPQIFIGDRHVGGYRELAALEAQGELDELLKSNRAAGSE